MKLSLVAPFGAASQETGLIALFGNFLRSRGFDATHLYCDGVLGICNRDVDNNWKRDIHTCFSCIKEQKDISNWDQLPLKSLGQYLSYKDIESSMKSILLTHDEDIMGLTFDGETLIDLSRSIIKLKYGVEKGLAVTGEQGEFLRSLMISIVRSVIAVKRYVVSERPSLGLLAGGEDYITQTFSRELIKNGGVSVNFQWDISSRNVKIKRHDSDELLSCELVLGDIINMRADVRTWPSDLIKILEGITDFVGLPRELPQAAIAS